MPTNHPNPKRASDRNAHANNPTPRTPRTTSEPAPARAKFSRICRGPACWTPACPDVSPYAALSSFSIHLATTHAPVRAPKPARAARTTPLLSLAESTLAQNTPSNPRRINTSTKMGTGEKARGARLRRHPLQRQNGSPRCPLAQSGWRSGAGESNLLQSQSCKKAFVRTTSSVSGKHRYMISPVEQVSGCTLHTFPVLNIDFRTGRVGSRNRHANFRASARHAGPRHASRETRARDYLHRHGQSGGRTLARRHFCANAFFGLHTEEV